MTALRLWLATLALGVASVAAASAAPADSVAVAKLFAWTSTYASRYSFQGLDYSAGRPVLQPALTASARGLTAGLWGNLDQARGLLNELDATLQRGFARGRLSGDVGYQFLQYPHRVGWAATHEGYLDLALDSPLAPSLAMHWDVAAGDGRYWTLGIAPGITRGAATFGLVTKLYVQEHYYGLTGIPAIETGVTFGTHWAGMSVQPGLSRLWAWPNGDFRGADLVRPSWVASLNFAPVGAAE